MFILTLNDSILAASDFLDRAGLERRDDNRRALSQLARRRGGRRSFRDERAHIVFVQVENRHRVSGPKKTQRDRAAHVAEADKTYALKIRHDSLHNPRYARILKSQISH